MSKRIKFLICSDIHYASELEKQRVGGRVHVLDVRGAAEFDAGHVPDALHVPHTRIEVNAGHLPVDKPLLVYCNSGARSAAAVAMLARLGFDAIDVNDTFANYRRAEQLAART